MFGPLICAVPTPFDKDNKVNEKLFVRFMNYLSLNGADGIVVAGTTGEGSALSEEEKIKLFTLAIKNRPENLKVIGNVGDLNTQHTIDLIKKVDHLPFDAYMVIVPYYVKPTQRGLFEHFKEIANSTKKDIMIYNVPSRCSVAIEYETVKCLMSTCKNIRALKHASPDLEMIRKLKEVDPTFEVYTGDDKYLLKSLRFGGDGVVSVIGNAFTADVKELIEDFKAGFENEKLNEYLEIISELMFLETNPAPLKYILTKKGFDYKNIRLPLVQIESETAKKIDTVLGD